MTVDYFGNRLVHASFRFIVWLRLLEISQQRKYFVLAPCLVKYSSCNDAVLGGTPTLWGVIAKGAD